MLFSATAGMDLSLLGGRQQMTLRAVRQLLRRALLQPEVGYRPAKCVVRRPGIQ
jgi:hypothetical protein